MKEGLPILKKAGFERVEDLPRTAAFFSSKAYQDVPPHLRSSATSNLLNSYFALLDGLHCRCPAHLS